MGRVDRLRNRVEPFAVLYWHCTYTCQHLTLPAGPASLHKAWPYMVIVGSILNEDSLPLPPFHIYSRWVCYLSIGEGIPLSTGGEMISFCFLPFFS